MNKEQLARLRTAAEYQKKAIKALLPKKVVCHLDVIKGEVKSMLTEMVAEAFIDIKEVCSEKSNEKENKATKKVNID